MKDLFTPVREELEVDHTSYFCEFLLGYFRAQFYINDCEKLPPNVRAYAVFPKRYGLIFSFNQEYHWVISYSDNYDEILAEHKKYTTKLKNWETVEIDDVKKIEKHLKISPFGISWGFGT